jgi:ABC-type transport system substrate-binding protein
MNTRFVPQVNRSLILLILLTGSFSPVQAGALDRLDHPAAGTADTPHPILTTQVVRQAIAYCTDRFALAQAAYPDLTDLEIEALMMDSFLPKDNWAYHQPAAQYPYAPPIGKALLFAAGWTVPEGEIYRVNPDGQRLALKLTTSQTEARYAWAEALEAQLLECGIQLLRFHANADWLFGDTYTGLSRRDFEIAGFTWLFDESGGFEQPVGLFGCDYIPSEENGWGDDYDNLMGWCNPVASEAAEQAGNLSLTQEQRKPFFATLQEEFAADLPSLPLFLRPDAVGYEHIDFNFSVQPPPPRFLNQLGVRRAIAYCTDRFALAKAVYPDRTDAEIEAMLTDTFLPTDHWAYAEPSNTYSYDPQAGMDLLDALGWTVPAGETYRTDGANERLAVVLSTTNAEARLAWGELFEQQMQVCGILVPRFHTDSDWFLYHALPTRDFELGGFGWIVDENGGYYDLVGCDQIPSQDNGWTGWNYAGWCNPIASAAAEGTSNMDLTREERKPYYATLQEQFAIDLPWLVLYSYWDEDEYIFEHIEFHLDYPLKYVHLPLIGK